MDIRDEIKASKVDKSTQSSLLPDSNLLPKSSLLPDSDQNNPLNKPQLSSGVKGIDRVSPIKSKDTGNSDSPRRRLITMSERDKLLSSNPQPVSQFNPITGKYKAPKHKAPVKNPTAVVYKARKQKTPVKKPAAVVEKPDAVVDKAPKHKAPAKKPASVVVNDPAELDQEKDKEKHKAPAKEPASVVGRVCDVAKQIMFHVEDALNNEAIEKASDVVNDSVVVESVCDVVKASDALKNKVAVVKEKSDGKGKKSTVDKDNDKAKDNAPNPKDNKSKAHSDVVPVAEKPKPNPKQKEKSTVQELSEVPVLRSSNQKVNPDVKSKKDFVDSSSDEADRKRKKLKIKAGLKRKRSGSDSSDSSSIDTAKVKRLISKLEKKVKKQESDEESVPKKGKKKMTKKIKKEESDEESVPKKGFSSLHNVSIDQLPSKLGWFVVSKFENYMLSLDTGDKIEVTRQKIHDMLGVPIGGYSLFDLDEREADHEFVKLWVGQFHPLELRDLRVNDIARKLVAAKEIDFLFKVNFLTLFTNTMGKADGLKGKICLDVVKRLREDSVISEID
ncbi:hypothetical protein Tco_1222580, partial [Tanacetum coccineum]